MAKKKKTAGAEKAAETVLETAKETVKEAAKEASEDAKAEKKSAAKAEKSEGKKQSKKGSKEEAKKGNFISRWFKDLKMELSKVVWPKRETVVNNSIVVFAAMLGCAVFTWLLEQGFLKLFELAISGKS